MLADEKLVGALCANFAEAAEPEASASLLIRLCMSKESEQSLLYL
jgi:hypothetical protein